MCLATNLLGSLLNYTDYVRVKPVTSMLLSVTDTSSHSLCVTAIHEAASFSRGSQFGLYWILKSNSFISFNGLGFCILKCHIEVFCF